MGLVKGSSGGFDYSKVSTIISKQGTITLPANGITSAMVTILNVTGKGYLRQALLASVGGSATSQYLKITVDGIVTFFVNSGTSSISIALGLVRPECYIYTASGTRIKINTSSTSYYSNTIQYPYTNNVGGSAPECLCNLPQDIYFKQSLLIEAVNTYASSSYDCTYDIQGGVL